MWILPSIKQLYYYSKRMKRIVFGWTNVFNIVSIVDISKLLRPHFVENIHIRLQQECMSEFTEIYNSYLSFFLRQNNRNRAYALSSENVEFHHIHMLLFWETWKIVNHIDSNEASNIHQLSISISDKLHRKISHLIGQFVYLCRQWMQCIIHTMHYVDT